MVDLNTWEIEKKNMWKFQGGGNNLRCLEEGKWPQIAWYCPRILDTVWINYRMTDMGRGGDSLSHAKELRSSYIYEILLNHWH